MTSAGVSPASCDQRGLRARRGLDRVARVAQVRGDERRDRRLVLDDEDRVRRRHGDGLRLRRRDGRLEGEALGLDRERRAAQRLDAAVGAVERVDAGVVAR